MRQGLFYSILQKSGKNPLGVSYGIAFGLISYIVISCFCGDCKKIKPWTWIITFLFVAMLLLTH